MNGRFTTRACCPACGGTTARMLLSRPYDDPLLRSALERFYAAVLSSHCLKHAANPLAALKEWHRVTRTGRYLLLVLPDPTRTFDHRRPVTTLAHLRDDSALGTPEDDQTHMDEVLALHDLARDPGAGLAEEFRQRVRDNVANRCLHHHVFDLALIVAVLAETGWRVLAAETARPLHLLALARKEPA